MRCEVVGMKLSRRGGGKAEAIGGANPQVISASCGEG